MAESIKASFHQPLPAAGEAERERWPLPRTAVFVTLSSAGLWALIVAAASWLIG